jgi:hypothetical protein
MLSSVIQRHLSEPSRAERSSTLGATAEKKGGFIRCASCDFTKSSASFTVGASAVAGALIGAIAAAFVAKPGNLPAMGGAIVGGALLFGGTVNYLTNKKIASCSEDCE